MAIKEITLGDNNGESSGNSRVKEVADAAARLALTGLSRGARVYQIDNGFYYELRNPAAPSSVASWKPEPKKYIALMSQSNTAVPVATILENDLGGVPTWQRWGAGLYTAHLTNAFPIDKTTILVGSVGGQTRGFAGLNANSVTVISMTTAGTASDNLLLVDGINKTVVEIRVYP